MIAKNVTSDFLIGFNWDQNQHHKHIHIPKAPIRICLSAIGEKISQNKALPSTRDCAGSGSCFLAHIWNHARKSEQMWDSYSLL
jgi:hypothetical protein